MGVALAGAVAAGVREGTGGVGVSATTAVAVGVAAGETSLLPQPAAPSVSATNAQRSALVVTDIVFSPWCERRSRSYQSESASVHEPSGALSVIES